MPFNRKLTNWVYWIVAGVFVAHNLYRNWTHRAGFRAEYLVDGSPRSFFLPRLTSDRWTPEGREWRRGIDYRGSIVMLVAFGLFLVLESLYVPE